MKNQPKQRLLPSTSSDHDFRHSETSETVWEIDVDSIEWSITLSYLMTVPDEVTKNVLKTFLRSQLSLPERKIKRNLCKIKKKVRKFNLFLKRPDIQNDKWMKKFIINFKNFLFSNCNENDWHSLLQNAANNLKCAIYLYSIDYQENCQFYSLLEPDVMHGTCHNLIIFCAYKSTQILPKFNFGLPSKFAECMRQKCLNKILRKISLSEEEIQEIHDSKLSKKNFLFCILPNSCNTIIPALYKPPYIARKLSELGFAVDPRITDENGYSAFHYYMDLPDTRLIWLLYNFVVNMFYLNDYSVRNPNDKVLDILMEINQVIERDIARAKKVSPRYQKIAGQILRFNQYQKELIEETLRLKQTNDLSFYKMKMITILKKYKEYFYFQSPLCNHTLDLNDELGLFHNFVLHTEYHESLDVFTSMVFFDQFPHIIGCINQTNEEIFTDTLSSLFLSILSNNFFPKYDHIRNACNCDQEPDKCEQEINALRFTAFYYRQCFLSKTVALAEELECSLVEAQSQIDLLEIIMKSLIHLREIEDEFLIVRIKVYLETAIDSSHLENTCTRMLTFERTLQVLGDILNNETASKTVVRFLIGACLPAELRHKMIQIRHHCFSKYRENAVQGRLRIERGDPRFLDSIQKDLRVLDQAIQTVFDTQILRVKEYLIEKCQKDSGCVFNHIISKLDKNRSEIILRRKEIFLNQKESLSCILRALFKYAVEELDFLEKFTDFKDLSGAITYFLKFVAVHWKKCSIVLLQISDKLENFISGINTYEISDQLKFQLNILLSDNLKILENIFSSIKTFKSPFDFSYRALTPIFSRIKDLDIFNEKEKMEIIQKLSEYVVISNTTIEELVKDCSDKNGFDSPAIFEKIIANEKDRSKLWEGFRTIYKLNKLHEMFRDTKQILNKTLFSFLCGNLDDYQIFSSEEKAKIKDIYEFWQIQSRTSCRSLLESELYMANDSEFFYDRDPLIKALVDRLNTLFIKEDKCLVIDKRISKISKQALKTLNAIKKEQKHNKWLKDLENNDLNLYPEKEEYLSLFLKISLPNPLKHKLVQNLNKKMLFLIDRIQHMRRLLIFEDVTIYSLWSSNTWKENQNEEKHLKSLMVQRYLTEKRVKASLELLLCDCMLILECDDLENLWKKTNNMFIGANMIQIFSHGNPLIEAAGSILDPTDLASDIIDKILYLIKDVIVLQLLFHVWVRKKICRAKYLMDYIFKKNDSACELIKQCPKWEKYFNLLPLKY